MIVYALLVKDMTQCPLLSTRPGVLYPHICMFIYDWRCVTDGNVSRVICVVGQLTRFRFDYVQLVSYTVESHVF